jgi:hypothetical protein
MCAKARPRVGTFGMEEFLEVKAIAGANPS